MPGYDGTGPTGTGPQGRGMGPCQGGRRSVSRRLGLGLGWGRGRGYGRGFNDSNDPAQLEVRKNWLRRQLDVIETLLGNSKN